ncbi:MAG: hypothetical protein ABI462_00935 [Ignavibacteria bacterium]
MAGFYNNLMHGTKLHRMLSTFSKEEFRSFGKFITSPYFNNRTEAVKFYEAVKSGYPEFSGEKYSNKNLHSFVYKDRRYNDATMRKLCSVMYGLTEEFLINRSFAKEPVTRRKFLLKELSRRKMDDIFMRHKELAENYLKNKESDAINYLNLQELQNVINSNNDNRGIEEEYQKEADHFFNFFIAKSLEIYTLFSNYKYIRNTAYNHVLFNEIVKHTQNNLEYYRHFPQIRIYFSALMVALNEKDENFYELIKLKDQYINILDDATKYNLYLTLQIFCVKRNNEGITTFRKIRFQIDNEFLARKLYKEREFFSQYFFTTSALNAIVLGRLDWAEKFMNDFKEGLNPKRSGYSYNVCLAELLYARKNYEEALSKLSNITIEYDQGKHIISHLKMKIFYKLGYYDSAVSLIDTMRHLFRKDKITPARINESYKLFLRFMLELIKIKSQTYQNTKERLENLIVKLNTSKGFRNKDWLEDESRKLLLTYKK